MSERQRRPRPVRKAVLIVCEGRETEPSYFTQLNKTLGLDATVDVVVDGKTGYTDPIGLVEAALALRDKRKKEAKKSATLAEFEDVWVVFDVEHASNGRGPQVAPAAMRALAKQIQPAISLPSFEVWYLLHTRPTPPGLTCGDDAKPHLTSVSGITYGKDRAGAQKIAAWAMSRTAVALKHGERQDVFQGPNHSPSAHVPSAVGTGVHRLVQSLVDMSSDAAGKQLLGFPAAPTTKESKELTSSHGEHGEHHNVPGQPREIDSAGVKPKSRRTTATGTRHTP